MKLPVSTGVDVYDSEIPVADLSNWSEVEIGRMVSAIRNMTPISPLEDVPIFGSNEMLAALQASPLGDVLTRNMDAAITLAATRKVKFTTDPIKFVPMVAYVIHEYEGQVVVENVHGTRSYVIPEEFVQRGELPVPMGVIYHVPFGSFIYDGVVRIGYDHNLAIWFAEEYLQILKSDYVTHWAQFHKSNPLLRVRNPR